MKKTKPESKLNSKKIRCLQSAFNSIEQKHDAERQRIREQIVREKEDWLKTQQKLSREEYNFLWDFFFENNPVERTVNNQEIFLSIYCSLRNAFRFSKIG